MSDIVLIPYGDDAGEVATDLLKAATDLGLDPVHAVKNQPDDGGFRVVEEVAQAAGYGEPDEPEKDPADEPEKKPARKRAPAKKTAAKKTAKKTEE